MLTSVIGVVVLLGGLIFFHELGHYLIAKLFGIKVEVFSLGFGKKLATWQWGETEYCLSLFPLGGYVKLMGDDPYKGVPAAEADRAFSTQKLYKRFLVVAAGPTFNLILAYILFVVVFWAGLPMASTRIGEVVVDSPAWQAGLRARDRIVEISGHKLGTWTDMEDYLKPKTGETVDLQVQRGADQLKIPYQVTRITAKDPYGEDEEVGGIKGISPNPLAPAVGISSPGSVAYAAGLRTGDVITKIDTRAIDVYSDINQALAASWKPNAPLTVSVNRHEGAGFTGKGTDLSFPLTLPAEPAAAKLSPLGLSAFLGMYPSELFVKAVNPGSPAEKGGLKAGDRVVSVGGQTIYNFDSIVDSVQILGKKNESAKFVVERAGKLETLDLKPVETTSRDPMTQEPVKKYLVGFSPDGALHEADLTKVQVREPGALVAKSFDEVNTLAKRMVVSLAKLAVGKISVKNLGGPVLIASVAGKSLSAGIIPFLQMMALISINLFLLNLFPVPILDGGHLFFFLVEGIKGKPVSLRTMEIATQVGMVLILCLVAVTFFNDISRIVMH